jgi:tRNA-specific 2-thiouridylase
MGAPVYVCGKNMAENTVTVGEESLLFAKTLWAENCNFIPFETLTAPLRVKAKTRSRMQEQDATVYPDENGFCRVVFDEPQRAITPGQAVVLYDCDTVIAGGTIAEAFHP